MADDQSPLPGGHNLDDYEIRESLGVGALGIEYVAFDRNRGKSVVVKEYLPDQLAVRTGTDLVPKSSAHRSDFETGLNHFLEEGEALTRIAHPNLAAVLRCLKANGTGYIVREFVEGELLSGVLERNEAVEDAVKQTLTEAECTRLLFPILDGLEALHGANFLHRDIGPDEIVIREDGTPVLLGFPQRQQGSAARQVFRARSLNPSVTLRPGYAALEQYSQMGHLGPWTDIYGMAAVMYRCATGLEPPEAIQRALADEMRPVSEATRESYQASLLAGIDTALATRAPERPQNVAAWRRSFAVPDHPERGVRQAARGQMFAPKPLQPDPMVAVAAAAHARTARSRSPRMATAPESRRPWAVPTIAAMAFVALLTWVDTGILRSSGVERDASAGLLVPSVAPSESQPGVSRQESSAEPLQSTTETPRTTSTPAPAGERSSQAQPTAPRTAATEQRKPLPTRSTLVVETTPPGAEVLIAGEVMGQTPLQIPDLSAGVYDVTLRHALYATLSEAITLPDPADPSRPAVRMQRTLARATGALTVRSEPAGAWIERDGKRLATPTPTTIRGLPAGPLTLTIGAPAHQPLQVNANVPKDGVGTLALTLERSIAYGTLTLELMPDDAEAMLPDLGLAYEAGMRVPEGRLRVTVGRDGYLPETQTIEVAGSTRSSISLSRNPQPFTVSTSPHGAFVTFPHRDQGYRPGVMLTPGQYRVRAVLPGHETWEGTVDHDSQPTNHAVTLRAGAAEFADPLVSGGVGPTMVAIPAGSFRMGCVSRVDCRSNEMPVRDVTLATPLALSKFEVTCADFGRFARAAAPELTGQLSACDEAPSAPAVNVSWEDAVAYTEWLSSQTHRRYRLPSEAEWEYAARAGAQTRYSWGNSVGVERANCNGCRSRANRDQRGTVAVGSFRANPWGLHDMHGNAWEWVSDCRFDTYDGAAGDGSSRTAPDCEERVLRGGSWRVNSSLVRAAQRGWGKQALRLDDVGIRVVVPME